MFAVLRRNLIPLCILLVLISLAPRPALSQTTSIDFGNVTIGQSNDHVLTKTLYISAYAAFLNPPLITGPNAADFQITQSTLVTGNLYHNGDMVSFTIQFAPSTTGSEQATFTGSGYTIFPYSTFNYTPVTLTGNGVAVPPPPITVSAAKLAIPTLDSNPVDPTMGVNASKVSCTFHLWFIGQGLGDVKGHWVVDGVNQPVDFGKLSLSNTWQEASAKAELSEPQSDFLGHHTVMFTFDVPQGINTPQGASTGPTDSFVTNFDPALNGWLFHNFSDPSVAGAADGVCIGMSLSAASGQANTNLKYTKRDKEIIETAQKAGNNHVSKVDNYRLLQYLLDDDATDQLLGESELLREHLNNGDPWVMVLSRHRLNKGGSHAVVPFALFDVTDVYASGSLVAHQNAHRFCIYDPNDPGNINYVDIADVLGSEFMDPQYDGYTLLSSF